MSSDAIVLLRQDHKEIERAFKAFEKAGDGATKEKGRLVDRIVELLTVHTYIENEVMYPRVRELVPELSGDIDESYEEHHVADLLVMELVGLKPDADRFDAKVTVLIENVRHHVEEEEQEWFPQVREALGRKQLQELGAELEQARAKAPRKPSQPSALKKTVDAVIK
jgi:hemerythrin superfamily protein